MFIALPTPVVCLFFKTAGLSLVYVGRLLLLVERQCMLSITWYIDIDAINDHILSMIVSLTVDW